VGNPECRYTRAYMHTCVFTHAFACSLSRALVNQSETTRMHILKHENTRAHAYKQDANGAVRLFRPDMNMKRFKTSCARLSLPAFEV